MTLIEATNQSESLQLTSVKPDSMMPLDAWQQWAQEEAATSQADLEAARAKEQAASAAYDAYVNSLPPRGNQAWFTMSDAEAGRIDRQREDLAGARNQAEAEADKATRQKYWRGNQLTHAQAGNYLVDASDLASGALDEYLPIAADLPPSFSLPKTETPPTDPAEVVRQLNTLPFVSEQYANAGTAGPQVIVRGIRLPVARIISAPNFAAFSGRGTVTEHDPLSIPVPNGMGSKPSNDPEYTGPETSRDVIAAYAQAAVGELGSGSKIMLVRDAAGEYWGMSIGDSSHRLSAAKLRGEPEITVGQLIIPSDQDMSVLPFSVRERFSMNAH